MEHTPLTGADQEPPEEPEAEAEIVPEGSAETPAAFTGARAITVPAAVVPLFVFLHIPKTAGTTLRWVLKKMFDPYYHVHSERKSLDKAYAHDPAFFDDKLLLAGHFARSGPIVRAIKGRRPVFITVMRDPVKRAVSYYDYLLKKADHPLHADVRDSTLREAFATKGRFRNVCENQQLRIVFGPNGDRDFEHKLATDNYIIGNSENLAVLVEAVAAISGISQVPSIPTLNRKDSDWGDLVRANQQPDYEEGVALIREANAREYEFFERFDNNLIVTTATKSDVKVRPRKLKRA